MIMITILQPSIQEMAGSIINKIIVTKKEKTMQNKEILEALTKAVAEYGYSKYSFVIDNNQSDKVIGNAKDTLEINNYIIKNVEIVFNTAQVVVIRSNIYNSIYGWESKDSALMFSCIKKVYRDKEIIFDCTK